MAPLNPVLRRELKERMRSRVTGFVLTLYLGVLALVLYGLYRNAQLQQSGGINPLATANLGRGMFESLLFAVLLLVCFLVPGYTASAVVGERERETLIPMQVTLLSPRSIIFGKLLASLAYLALLVVATIPLLAGSFLFGGVTPTEMLKGIGMVMATGVLLASLSLLVSTMSRRVQTATVLAYGLTLTLVLGTFAVYGFEVIASNRHGVHNKAVLAINPLVATADAVAARSGGDVSPGSPLTSLRNMLRGNNTFQTFSSSAGAFGVPGGGIVVNGGPIPVNGGNGLNQFAAQRPPSLPPYAAYALGFFAVVSAAALGLAMRRITTPRRTTRT